MSCDHPSFSYSYNWEPYGPPRPGDGAVLYREIEIRQCDNCPYFTGRQTGNVDFR